MAKTTPKPKRVRITPETYKGLAALDPSQWWVITCSMSYQGVMYSEPFVCKGSIEEVGQEANDRFFESYPFIPHGPQAKRDKRALDVTVIRLDQVFAYIVGETDPDAANFMLEAIKADIDSKNQHLVNDGKAGWQWEKVGQ